MERKKKRLIQFVLLGIIIFISFSFLFSYANKDNQNAPIGISSVENHLSLYSKHKDSEKEDSPKEDALKEQTNPNQTEIKENSQKENNHKDTTKQTIEGNQEQEVIKNDVTQKEDEQQKEQANIMAVTFSIDMKNILDHKGEVDSRFQKFIPADGVLLAPMEIEVEEGENVYSILKKICNQQGIPLDASGGYVKYINNIGERDAGISSGWLYTVNGVIPSVGSTQYQVKAGDVIAWRYTVKMGDV